MIVYISTNLLLIGIIKNYNRGSFILAVSSIAPASINIVSPGLPNRIEEVLQAFRDYRGAWKREELPDHRESLDRQGIAQYPSVDGEGEKRPPAGQPGNSVLARRRERLRR